MSNYSSEHLSFPEDRQEFVQNQLDRFEDMSEAFVEDLIPFARVYQMLTKAEQATWATKVPDEYSFMTNSNSNILNWAYTGHKVLKNLGAPVEIVGSAGDRDQKIILPDSQVAHYALPLSPSRLILTNLIVNSEQPGFDLLKMGVADHFIPGSYLFSSEYTLGYENIPGIENLKEQDLPERHFLFSALRAGVMQLYGKSGRLDKADRESLSIYEKLRKNEYTPLGPEEVYGIMTSAILSHLERHPEQDFREKPQPKDLDLL